MCTHNERSSEYVFANQPCRMINGLLVEPGRAAPSKDTEQTTLARRERGVLYQQPPAFSEAGRGLGVYLTVLGTARGRRLRLSEHASQHLSISYGGEEDLPQAHGPGHPSSRWRRRGRKQKASSSPLPVWGSGGQSKLSFVQMHTGKLHGG